MLVRCRPGLRGECVWTRQDDQVFARQRGNGEVRAIRHGRDKVACNDGAGHSCMGGGAANGRNGELNGALAIRLQQA